MPSYGEIATLRTPTGSAVQSKLTAVAAYNSSSGGASFVYNESVSGTRGFPVVSMFDFWDHWLAIAKMNAGDQVDNGMRALFNAPEIFNDEGVIVDASREWADLPTGQFLGSFVIERGLDDNTDFIVAATFERFRQDNLYGNGFIVSSLTASNEGSNVGDKLIQGHKVRFLVGSKEFLPLRTSLEPMPLWVRSDPVLGDFSSLVISGEDVIDRGAQKTVRLETLYNPILEDLDNIVTFGKDINGLPLDWNISGTERDRGSRIYLNLVSFTS